MPTEGIMFGIMLMMKELAIAEQAPAMGFFSVVRGIDYALHDG